MDINNKSKEELIKELLELQQVNDLLKTTAEADNIKHKQTMNALQESEERFQLLFNKAPLGYQSLDFDGNFIEVNQQWLDTLGYNREEVIGKWFGDFLSPAYKDGFRQRFPIFKAQGHIHSEFEMVHKNGSVLFIAFDGRIGYDLKGDFKQTHCILQDITERKKAEQDLKRIEWLLNLKPEEHDEQKQSYIPPYGDLIALNTNRFILDSVGEPILKDIVGDYLNLLDTSSAVYEKNGDYALGIFSSGWCRFMDAASRAICDTNDNREALDCGRWHCHESCWSRASKTAIETGQPADIECDGGIRLYAVPIRVGDEVVGAINFGYGEPPRDEKKLRELAINYKVSYDELLALATKYESRPPYIIDLAKQRLKASARLIGEIIIRKQAESLIQEKNNEIEAQNEEYKQVNEELLKAKEIAEESEIKLRSILDSTPFPVAVVDADDENIEFWSRSALLLFGHTASTTREWCQKAYPNLEYRNSAIVRWKPFLEKAKLTNSTVNAGEYEITCKNGNVCICEIHVTFLIDKLIITFNDITERKKADKKLLISDRIFNHALDMLCVAGFDGYFKTLNPSWSKVLGYSIEELLAKPWIEKVHPDDRDKTLNIKASIVDGQEIYQFENRYICKDGSIKWLSWNSFPDSNKNIMYGVARDVTESKKAQEALSESEIQYRNLADAGLALVWKSDTNKSCYYFNKTWLDFTGKTLEQETGIGWADGIHPEDYEPCLNIFVTAFDKREKFEMEYRLLHFSGKYRWILDLGTPNYNAKGEFVGYIGHCFDITERKIAEETLRKSEENLSITLHSIGDGVISTDIEGLIVNMNPVAEKLCGWMLNEALGKPLSEVFQIINAETRQIVADPAAKVLEDGEVVGLANHTVLISKDGNEYQIADSAAPIKNKEGIISGVVLVFSDVTEKYATENELKESEERYKALHNASFGGITIHDKGIIIECNQGLAEITGYAYDELIGMDGLLLIAPNSRDIVLSNILAGYEKPYEAVGIRKNGELYPLQLEARNVSYKGKSVRTVEFRDITERKKVEDALRKSEEMMLNSQSVAHICSYSTNLNENAIETSIWVCSPEFYKIFGIDETYPHTIEGWANFIHPAHRNEIVAYHEYVIKNRLSFSHEYKIIRINDGVERWVHGTGELVFDELGNPVRMYGAIQDITERKLAEDALQKSEAIKEKMVSNIGDVIVIIDKEGINRYKSPNIEKWFGWKPEDVVGHSTWENVHPEDLKASQEFIQSLANEPNACGTTEFRYRKKDGSYCPIEITVVNLLQDPNIQGFLGNYHNITERKKTEQELISAKEKAEESEQRFKCLIENAPDGVVIIDEKGLISYGSPNATRQFGYTADEIIGQAGDEFTHPDDLPLVLNALETIMYNPNEKPIVKYRFKHKNGDFRWIETTFSNLLSEKAINGIVLNFTDITERKKNEEKNQLLSSIIEYSQDFIGLATSDQKAFYVNQAGQKMVGIESEEMLIKTKIEEYFFPEDLEFVNNTIFPTLMKEGRWAGEFRFRNFKTNKPVHVFYDLFLTADPITKKIINISTISRDITAQKSVEQELISAKEKAEESQMKFKAIADTSPLAIHISKGINQIATYINPKFYQLFGYTYEEAAEVSLWWPRAYPETDYRNNLIKEWNLKTEIAIANKSNIAPMETVVTCKDGSKKNILWGFVSTGNENWAFGMDLTAYRKTEQELISAKEKAEESDKLKSAFLANMSHEIRTPMNGILGFAELLKRPDLTGKQQQDYIRIIEKSGVRMLNIINDIVDISKIEAGLMNIEMKESNINEQIEYIYTFFKPEVEAKGMKLSFSTALPAKNATIITDREKVYAILTNLVKNAIKYTNHGTIEFGYKIADTQSIDYLQFYVKDTGIGIPEDRQAAIFERFIQADIVDEMARQGAGLGLSITKAYIEMLGGKIWVESEVEVGSTFYFTLPYTIESMNEIEVQNVKVIENISRVKKLNILIAEDDEVSEMLINEYVNKFSNKLFRATTGSEAIQVCRNNPDIDLVLMDIKMPEMNGYEATRQIRSFNKDVVIVAQTAYGQSGDREKAIDAGCNDYITKPIVVDHLLAIIDKFFGK